MNVELKAAIERLQSGMCQTYDRQVCDTKDLTLLLKVFEEQGKEIERLDQSFEGIVGWNLCVNRFHSSVRGYRTIRAAIKAELERLNI